MRKTKTKKQMEIEAERSSLIKDLRQIKDLSILKSVKDYLLRKMAEAKGIDIDEYNREIDEAGKQMEAGHFVTHEEVLQRLSKWKRKGK